MTDKERIEFLQRVAREHNGYVIEREGNSLRIVGNTFMTGGISFKGNLRLAIDDLARREEAYILAKITAELTK